MPEEDCVVIPLDLVKVQKLIGYSLEFLGSRFGCCSGRTEGSRERFESSDGGGEEPG